MEAFLRFCKTYPLSGLVAVIGGAFTIYGFLSQGLEILRLGLPSYVWQAVGALLFFTAIMSIMVKWFAKHEAVLTACAVISITPPPRVVVESWQSVFVMFREFTDKETLWEIDESEKALTQLTSKLEQAESALKTTSDSWRYFGSTESLWEEMDKANSKVLNLQDDHLKACYADVELLEKATNKLVLELIHGRFPAEGLCAPYDINQPIARELWRILDLDVTAETATGFGHSYRGIVIGRPTEPL
ncbi:MAG TPA: hypothetical protein VGM59_15330 [Dongiaceae bacterium]|jgi:hypothetical protein